MINLISQLMFLRRRAVISCRRKRKQMAESGQTLLPLNYSDFIVRGEDRKSLPWDRFNCWIKCFCVVTFDLELGQVIEVCVFCRPACRGQKTYNSRVINIGNKKAYLSNKLARYPTPRVLIFPSKGL